MDAGSMKDKEKAENELSKTIKSIFAVAENYPQLRANENFLSLQEELTDTENKIEASRRFYNANVRDYNIKIRAFPSNIFANMFNFEEKQLFEVEPSQKAAIEQAPKVEI
jgi:LemA protein